jgi:hypothetical protein
MRRTFQCKLSPTSAQQQALEVVLSRCCTRYNTALQERTTTWERRGVCITYSQQQAEVPDLKVDVPD